MAATDQAVIRRLSHTGLELELLESRRAAGQEIDPGAYASLCNLERRLRADFERIGQRNATGVALPRPRKASTKPKTVSKREALAAFATFGGL